MPGPNPLAKFSRAGQIATRRCTLRLASPPEKAGVGADAMLNVKDTLRATVRLSFDGRVFKTYHGSKARKRFENEVRVLRHLEARRCGFVPRLLEADPEKLTIITTNCGARVEQLDEPRRAELFAELEQFGVRHDDPDVRNVTYRIADGRFCIIDFEFATILPDPPSLK
jgi:tRNA A-37 threonylcarbamoyl transferase component Bud32